MQHLVTQIFLHRNLDSAWFDGRLPNSSTKLKWETWKGGKGGHLSGWWHVATGDFWFGGIQRKGAPLEVLSEVPRCVVGIWKCHSRVLEFDQNKITRKLKTNRRPSSRSGQREGA